MATVTVCQMANDNKRAILKFATNFQVAQKFGNFLPG